METEVADALHSQMLCIKAGDNNTKFFHKVVNSRRRYNHISMLKVNGVIYEDKSEMVDQAVQFFIKTCTRRLKSGGLLWKVWSLIS